MKRLCAIVCIAVLACSSATAQTIGMVAQSTGDIIIFDGDTDAILGTVSIPAQFPVGDCAVLSDGSLGFVTDFEHQVWVIDIPGLSLAAGTNPIPISNFGEDVDLSGDEKFLLVCDGSASQPVSVIDIAARSEIGTLNTGGGCNSVDVCDDGSILVTSHQNSQILRLTIDGAGNLANTGETRFVADPNNVYFAPGNATGVVVRRSGENVESFGVPGLADRDDVDLKDFGLVAVFNSVGDRMFVRSLTSLQAFTFNPITGAISDGPLYVNPMSEIPTFYGMDQMAIHPDDKTYKLYVSRFGGVDIIDWRNGSNIGTLSATAPTGICFQRSTAIELALDIKPGSCPNPLNIKLFQNGGNQTLRKGGVIPVAILGSSDFDVSEIDVATVQMEGVPALRSAMEDVATPVELGDDCHCTTANGDGHTDLTLKFQKSLVAATLDQGLQDGDFTELTVSGNLIDGTAFTATDCVRILSRNSAPGWLDDETEPLLFDPAPNPFNPVTRLRYSLPGEGFVRLSVFDVKGTVVDRLVNEVQPAGDHVAEWDAGGMSSGIYFYRLEVGDFKETRKMILLK